MQKSESPESHFSYVWKNIIEKTSCEKIFIVAHSYGGYLVVGYVSAVTYCMFLSVVTTDVFAEN